MMGTRGNPSGHIFCNALHRLHDCRYELFGFLVRTSLLMEGHGTNIHRVGLDQMIKPKFG